MESTNIVWKIVTVVLGVFLVTALVFVVIFGLKVKNYDEAKSKEISKKLAAQDVALKNQCQLEKEEIESTYVAADVYGNFQFRYPKVWSVNLLDDYQKPYLQFLGNPTLISDNSSVPPVVALRVMFMEQDYASKVKSYDKGYKKTEVTVSNLTGTKVTGTDKKTKKKVTVVLLPLRDKTLYIGTDDATLYSAEYEKILQSFVINK